MTSFMSVGESLLAFLRKAGASGGDIWKPKKPASWAVAAVVIAQCLLAV